MARIQYGKIYSNDLENGVKVALSLLNICIKCLYICIYVNQCKIAINIEIVLTALSV